MRRLSTLFTAAAFALSLGLVACAEEGDETGETIDDLDATDTLTFEEDYEAFGDEMREGADAVGEAIEEGAREAGEGLEKVGEAIQEDVTDDENRNM